MMANVEIHSFDHDAFAAEQRRLLKLATQKPKGRVRPDETAASKLLLYFSREMITDNQVQEAVMDGVREVAAYVANETLLRQDGQPVKINPLMFFQGVESDYKATKKNKKNERVALIAAFNDPEVSGSPKNGPLMTAEEAMYALTRKWANNDVKDQKFGKPEYRENWPQGKDLKDWPKTVKDVERKLVDYTQEKHGASDREACRNYVHSSFPAIAWHDDASKHVSYPKDWSKLTPLR